MDTLRPDEERLKKDSMENKKNVYELAQERLAMIFRDFDNVCVSFSGGKDSGLLLNLCIDYVRRNRLNRKSAYSTWTTKYSTPIPSTS